MSGNHFKKRSTVCHILSYRSDLIQRRRIGNQTITGYGTVSWLNSGHTTKRARLTDRSTCIRSECHKRFSCCNCRTGTTGRAARNMFCVPRVSCHSVSRSLCSTSHGKLIHICLTYNDHSCFFQTVNDLCIVLRNKILKDSGRTGCFLSFDTDIIFYCDRNTGKRTCISAVCNSFFHFFCTCICFFFVKIKVSMHRFFFTLNLVKDCFHAIHYMDLTLFYLCCQF